MWIRILCKADPDLGNMSASAQIQTRIQGVNKKVKFLAHFWKISTISAISAKFCVSQNRLKHVKASFVCFVFLETKNLAYETKRNYEKTLIKLPSFKSRSRLLGSHEHEECAMGRYFSKARASLSMLLMG